MRSVDWNKPVVQRAGKSEDRARQKMRELSHNPDWVMRYLNGGRHERAQVDHLVRMMVPAPAISFKRRFLARWGRWRRDRMIQNKRWVARYLANDPKAQAQMFRACFNIIHGNRYSDELPPRPVREWMQ
jgi:hypothetical protein